MSSTLRLAGRDLVWPALFLDGVAKATGYFVSLPPKGRNKMAQGRARAERRQLQCAALGYDVSRNLALKGPNKVLARVRFRLGLPFQRTHHRYAWLQGRFSLGYGPSRYGFHESTPNIRALRGLGSRDSG